MPLRHHNKIFALSTLLAAMLPTLAIADVQWNGFASIRGTSANSDGNTSPFPEYSEGEFSFKSESLFALQARTDLGDGLSATVQLYAEGKNDFDIEARWAYLSYEINDQHTVSAGRFANPIFHQSEYEKVGYAHNFSRLPKAVYIGFDFSTIEGIALDSQFNFDDVSLRTKVLYGSWFGDTYSTVTNTYESFGLKDLFAVNANLAGDWWQVFGGVFTTTMDGAGIDQNVILPLAAPGIAYAKANGATQEQIDALVNAVTWDEKDGLYWFAGFSVDYNNFLVDFEYADYGVKDSSDMINQVWFTSLGYRFDKFVVTVHNEEYTQDIDNGYLSAVTHPVLKMTGDSMTNAFGFRQFDGNGITLRWDFHPSAALKVDYFQGNDTRPTVGDYTITSIGVDLVF